MSKKKGGQRLPLIERVERSKRQCQELRDSIIRRLEQGATALDQLVEHIESEVSWRPSRMQVHASVQLMVASKKVERNDDGTYRLMGVVDHGRMDG